MSKFKYGVITDSFNAGFEEGLKKAAELGADGVQFYAVSGEISPETLSPSNIKRIQGLLKTNNLEISAVCGDLGGHGFSHKNENPYRVERSKLIMNLAYQLGARIVTTHIGVVPEDAGNERYKVMSEAAYELACYAEMMEMHFAIETGPEKAETLKLFLDQFHCKGMAVNLDPANLVMVTGDDPVKAVYTLKDYIVHTHAKDGLMKMKGDPVQIYTGNYEEGFEANDFFIETPLGEGGVDFKGYIAALKDIGYTGYLTLEREVGKDPAKDIALGFEYIKKITADV